MSNFDVAATLVTLAALFGFVNARVLRLPTTIGLMLIALAASLAMLVLQAMGFEAPERLAEGFVRGIDFNDTLMNGMLCFLLFAGALHIDLNELYEQKWVVATLATVGTLASTGLVGLVVYGLLQLAGVPVPLVFCLLFGALISPTDPIAVLGILKSVGAPRSLEIKIVGESLFNDGIGVVVFATLVGVVAAGGEFDLGGALILFLEEAVGGILFGLVLGFLSYWMLRQVDHYTVEILITLAVVMGGYSLSLALHTSGPLAMVVAGLFIGNHGRRLAMTDRTREHLDTFWEFVDEILNMVLFVLIGFELLVLTFTGTMLVAGVLAIPLVLAVRFVCVGVPIRLMGMRRTFTPGAARILTWGGLRGGISIALALSVPPGPERDLILPVTYMVVVFSIVVQGLTVGKLIARETGSVA